VRARAERQSINAPVQSCLNEMMLWAISIIEREIPEDELAVVGDIHDAFMGYANPATVQTYAQQAAQIMEHLPLAEMGWEPQVRFPADAEMGPDLAHLTKMQLAA
jgi:DNA polymerase I-like protein with 3'-5' exonuclease and polymerase domains